MGPNNGIIGDAMGTDLPQMQPDETALNELKHKAKYKRSTEYKTLKASADANIAFYQQYLPNGLEIGVDAQPSTEDWKVANRIIKEFRLLFDDYEVADEELNEVLPS